MSSATPDGDHSRREAVIRDLYALVAFYVANPEHPLPDYMQVGHYVPAETVERVAETYGGRIYGEGSQTHHDIPDTKRVHITLVVSQPSPDRPL